MAKPKKQKPEEQPKSADSSGGMSVLHQKLCLSIDMDKRRVHGYTELKIIVQEGQNVALHADNMAVTHITVNGEPTEFEYSSHLQVNEDDNKLCLLSCSQAASDVACSVYMSSLDKETVPNLLVACNKLAKSNQQQMEDNGKNIVESCFGEQIVNGHNGHPEEKNVMLLHIDYHIERAGTGIHFFNDVLLTDNQIRRSHCWFPCVYGSHQCTFDLEFTVNSNFVAVSNGDLLYQVLGKADPSCKTYVYKLTSPVSAEWISLIVAPFVILPDSHNSVISHMCLSPSFSMLQNTVGFFHNVFSHYEDYLSTCFPFGSYKQMFIPEEIIVSSINFGASTCVFSSHLLFDDKVIDQTIETRIKLAYALARQWFGVYITAEEPTDEWLIDGLAGFLTDTYVKRFLGNNEARYRRFKANAAVCKSDVGGATALSSSAATTDIYGTHVIGFYGKIRLWKAIAVLQMLEKQMGPECFRKILQNILHKATGRTLSSKEFRHLANKIGNLERPFLKEFFPRWVESCGCPTMRTGLSYNKRRNIIELAVVRGCTVKSGSVSGRNTDSETREGDNGWPGMMSIRVHELDGMYDHPVLAMAGENWQLLEIQCHSKLAAKRFQKPKKGSKPDGSDDNADTVSTQDIRNSIESPLLRVRVDPEMEYLAEIHFHQPVQMWVNQLEKDKDVIAQSQAISMLEKLPQLSFTVINALNSFLNDSKAFWRVRIEAAYALAHTTTEETDLAGLLHLVKFYKSRRFDTEIGLPRPNDFRDVQEYFVLEAIPHAVALVRAADRKSPREAIEFVLQLLKYNDNNGNPYSDVYWLAALVQSVGELEFGQQGIRLLSSLLKRIDRLMQFDSLMPSYNRVLTVSCIRTLAQIALKMSNSLLLDRVCELIKPFRNIGKTSWKVRIEASRVLLDLEFHGKGLNAALCLFIVFLDEESSLRGEIKLAAHAVHLCHVNMESQLDSQIASPTLVALLRLLQSRKSFNNVLLRHYLFAILQMLAGRSPTLHGAPKVQVATTIGTETRSEQKTRPALLKLKIPRSQEPPMDMPNSSDAPFVTETAKDADTVSTCSERKNVLKIRVRQSASSGRTDGQQMEYSRGGLKNTELAPSSPLSVGAPARGPNEQLTASNQNIEDVNSCHDRESRMTMSIGSAKFLNKEDIAKEFQCTADSKPGILGEEPLSPTINIHVEDDAPPGTASSQAPCAVKHDGEDDKVHNGIETEKLKKEQKDKKRKRDDKVDKKDDPEYLERKRLKKAKKKLEKELAKKQKKEERNRELKNSMLPELSKDTSIIGGEPKKVENGDTQTSKAKETTSETTQGSLAPKVRIRFKSRALEKI